MLIPSLIFRDILRFPRILMATCLLLFWVSMARFTFPQEPKVNECQSGSISFAHLLPYPTTSSNWQCNKSFFPVGPSTFDFGCGILLIEFFDVLFVVSFEVSTNDGIIIDGWSDLVQVSRYKVINDHQSNQLKLLFFLD